MDPGDGDRLDSAPPGLGEEKKIQVQVQEELDERGAESVEEEESGKEKEDDDEGGSSPGQPELGSEKDLESGQDRVGREEGDEGVPAHELAATSSPAGLAKASSRRTSVFSGRATVIPRAERRGLFGRFTVIPEVERPYEYRNGTKWLITAIVALAGTGAPIGSSIFYPALSSIVKDFHTTSTITNLAVALYMLAMSIFPLWWSSFSETFGRRTIYLISFTLFVIFGILSATSVNIGMLIAMRILGGGAAASVQAVGAGTIADIWETKERGRAMGIFYLGPLMGPLLAPIVGGALAQGLGWRSTMWFVVIYGGVMLVALFFGLPETLKRKAVHPASEHGVTAGASAQLSRVATTQSQAQSVKEQTQRAARIFKQFIVDPLQVLLNLRYPPVLVSVYLAAITFGALFVINISIQYTFERSPYNYPTIIIGLLYLPPSLGYVVSSTLGGRWVDHIMIREARRAGRYDSHGRLIYLPEDRMRENIWLAASLYPGAIIWYGWCAERGLPWPVTAVANFFFGVGTMLVFGAVTTMLTEFMPHRSSAGVAVNNFVRNIFSCVGAVVAQPLLDALGNGWVCTIVGLFAWVTGNAAIFALKRYGARWRVSMDQKMNKA